MCPRCPKTSVLDAASALVELLIGEFDDVKRIGHLGGVGQGLVKDRSVGAREIQGAVGDVGEELRPLGVQPRRGLDTASTRHDVEQLSACDVHDLGGELLAVVLALAHEEHLIETQRAHQGETRRVIIHQCDAVGQHGIIHGVPVTAEFAALCVNLL